MHKSLQILSDLTIFSKYAKYIPEEKRRETWEELVTRNRDMHMEQFPEWAESIRDLYEDVFDKKVLPSMRALQFSGAPIQRAPNRMYNCAYMAVDAPEAFSEAMFLLLGGTGVGFSVQKQHVRELPRVQGPTDRPRRFVVGDSIEGWADAVKVLIRAYFEGRSRPVFDFSDIRPKGARLVTSGGKAPGPAPLEKCLLNLRVILDDAVGRKLRPIEVHDMMCHIGDAVLAGGIRRAALISLFSFTDYEMRAAKVGAWWEQNPQRGRANNSAVVLRNRVSKREFLDAIAEVERSGCGEFGIYFTNDADMGTNPCAEIALISLQFCNLTTINAQAIKTQDDLNRAAFIAGALGTIQAAYTNFHYLRNRWKDITEQEALLGVSITGIACGSLDGLNLREAVEHVRRANLEWSKRLGINPAARLTAIKPEGTTSLVCGASSGIHAWHAPHYIRRLRFKKNEAIYNHFKEAMPELTEDDTLDPTGGIITIPVKAPRGAVFRDERMENFLARVKRFSEEWVKPGHNKGANTHNVSATVSVPEDQWGDLAEWMWDNRYIYNGLSLLPMDTGTYTQAPFEDITAEKYEEMCSHLTEFDLSQVIEDDDETDLQGEIACAGGACEI